MEVKAYFDRIGFSGDVKPDRSTLNTLMRFQLRSIPFENLDQQLGIAVSTDVPTIYSKIVEQGRGGWCFELNSLFAWVLSDIGFDVQTLAGHVGNDGSGRKKPADHMILLVDCGESLLVDVGFGGSLIEAIPMREVEVSQAPYKITISEVDDGFLRFSERAGGKLSSFDFKLDSVGQDHFDDVSIVLQTTDDSPFRRTLTVQRRHEDRHVVLRGRLLRTIKSQSTDEILLATSDELVSCLHNEFGLVVPEIKSVWPRITKRHFEIYGTSDHTPSQ